MDRDQLRALGIVTEEPVVATFGADQAHRPSLLRSLVRLALGLLALVFGVNLLFSLLTGSGTSSEKSAIHFAAPPPARSPASVPEVETFPISNMEAISDELGVMICADLKNNSSRTASGNVEFPIYDDQDRKVDVAFDVVRNLAPGETWRIKARLPDGKIGRIGPPVATMY